MEHQVALLLELRIRSFTALHTCIYGVPVVLGRDTGSTCELLGQCLCPCTVVPAENFVYIKISFIMRPRSGWTHSATQSPVVYDDPTTTTVEFRREARPNKRIDTCSMSLDMALCRVPDTN